VRVCLITEEHEGWGGIGTYTAVLARGLSDLGHQVHVIVRSWEEDEHDEHAHGIVWHHTPLPEPSWRFGTRTVNERLYTALGMLRWSRRVCDRLHRLCETEPIEVVEAPDFHAQGLHAGRWRGGPTVVVKLHTPAFIVDQFNAAPAASRADRALSARLEQRALRTAALITAPSRALASRVSARWSLRDDPVIVAHPIDAALFAATPPSAGAEVLFVGRLERVKGVETLIDAVPAICSAVEGFRLTLIGEDDPEGFDGNSMAAHLHARLAHHGVAEDTVRFAGAIPRHELPARYAQAALCVVPSAWEGFPYVALEAMSCGRPVVASAVGGLVELVEDGRDGLLVAPEDPTRLAHAIVRLLRDPAECQRLGAAAREKVEQRFAQPAACAEAARVYERALARRGRR